MEFRRIAILSFLCCSTFAKLHERSCPVLDPGKVDDGSKKASEISDSQKCFLDCTREDAVDMVCEEASSRDVFNSGSIIPTDDPDRKFNVYLWNSAFITELGASIFKPALADAIRVIDLLNLPALGNFPMFRELENLKVLQIANALSLSNLAVDLLPAGLEKLILYKTGITFLNADLQSGRTLNVTWFEFDSHFVNGASVNFFHIFPNLKVAKLRYNSLQLSKPEKSPFNSIGYLDKFILSNNDYSAVPTTIRASLATDVLASLKMAVNSTLDLSNNGLLLSKDVVLQFDNLVNVSSLSLAGNQFGQFFAAVGMFEKFKYLRKLDVSFTDLPRQKGVFRGLENLELLVVSGNEFRDLTRVDIFEGCNAKLRALDLSSNMLMSLPSGRFLDIAPHIQELDLSNNTLHTELMDEDNLPAPIQRKHKFTNLRLLDLSSTQLQEFKGQSISHLAKLVRLDISCNRFKRVTREFFKGLPASLQVLNMSFCVDSMQMAPKVDKNAFSAFGDNSSAIQLRTLILQSGYFRGWILHRLQQLPVAALNSLRDIDISRNQIRYLEPHHVANLTMVTSLDLSRNFIQNIGPGTFTGMTSLTSLNLAYNHIVSISTDELANLDKLVTLDLSHNLLVNIDKGAFDSLPRLQELYIGWNRLTYLPRMFRKGGKSLLHLGIQGNGITLRTFPIGCIDRYALDPLDNLQYFYIDQGTAVFVDHGKVAISLADEMKAGRMKPNDDASMQCIFGYRLGPPSSYIDAIDDDVEPGGWQEWTNDFVRLVIQNPLDLSPRTFVSLTPKCVTPGMKYVGNTTTDFMCPFRDSKVWVLGDKKPGKRSDDDDNQ